MTSRPRHEKKRRFGRPPTFATPIMVRLLPEQLATLDAWAEEQADKPGRPEAIRRILAKYLRRRGYHE